jgi:hypothetical protein
MIFVFLNPAASKASSLKEFAKIPFICPLTLLEEYSQPDDKLIAIFSNSFHGRKMANFISQKIHFYAY